LRHASATHHVVIPVSASAADFSSRVRIGIAPGASRLSRDWRMASFAGLQDLNAGRDRDCFSKLDRNGGVRSSRSGTARENSPLPVVIVAVNFCDSRMTEARSRAVFPGRQRRIHSRLTSFSVTPERTLSTGQPAWRRISQACDHTGPS
jgi:hypothetical protein